MKKDDVDQRSIWVATCPHCGEDTLCEPDYPLDKSCSVCSGRLSDSNWRKENIPVADRCAEEGDSHD